MERRWIINQDADEQDIKRLSESLKYSEVLCNLLIQRGIMTKEEALAFFNPKLEDLNNPFLMKDMDKAISRLETAIKNKENIKSL